MPSKSKIKGATFERDIAKYLSTLYENSFTRTAQSGAYIGGSNSFRKNTLSEGQIKSYKGDIVGPDNWKYFNCELKNYKNFPFHRLIGNKPVPLLETWLDQLMEVADKNDINILIFKITHVGKYIAVEKHKQFQSTRYIEYSDNASRVWHVIEFDDFFHLNKTLFEQANIG